MSVVARRNRGWLVGALLVATAGFVILAYGQIGQNLIYYWGPRELEAAGPKAVGATIRLGGLVVPGSVVRSEDGSEVRFEVADADGTVRVRAKGVPPAMFREGIGVVVEGTMTEAGLFEGQRLMVSHSNEYRTPGEDHDANVEELIRSTRDLDEARR